jgi:hypothetical protein
MTDVRRPGDYLDKTLESIELAGTLDSGDSVAPPADVQAAKSVANIPADLSEPDCVHNIDGLDSMLDDFGSSPGVAKHESSTLEEEIDAVAETIATLAGNQGMGTESTVADEAETVETAAEPGDDQQEESAFLGGGEKTKTEATGLDDSPSVKQDSAARPSGKLPLFGLLLGLLGIAAGLGVGYYAYLLQSKLAVLDQRVEATVQVPPPAEEGAPAEVTRLHSRVEEVATLIEESSQMYDSSGEEIDSLKSRIAEMEQEIDGLRDKTADPSPTIEVQVPSLASDARIYSVPATSKGSWAVNFESHTSEKTAAAAVIRLRGQGINAEKYVHIKDGTTWYRIRVPGFSSSAEARDYAENILVKSGFSQAWIGLMQ